jgi:hypothetical protein
MALLPLLAWEDRGARVRPALLWVLAGAGGLRGGGGWRSSIWPRPVRIF